MDADEEINSSCVLRTAYCVILLHDAGRTTQDKLKIKEKIKWQDR